ncbi:membrane protein [Vibrio variabilis]|uniref:Membrane protein n=1 Tax=Vibrio variabilis TaxID=990271 RepID=A0ABQ0JJZ8_9VIBR|nr:membrane protein [Vibrio variabilis]
MNYPTARRYCPTLTFLTGFYCLVFAFSAIAPSSRAVWVAEIIPAVGILVLIWVVSRKFQFSKPAYLLMFIWLCLHTIGAKYTFAEVPFDWFNQMIGSERNNFDRVAHFSIGLYAFPIAEYVYRKQMMSKLPAMMFALFAIMSLAAAYEIIEWWYAALAGGDEGIAFLGSQGDIWDAQKDMLCDTLGAVTALILFGLKTPSKD